MAIERPKQFNPEDFFGFLFRLRDVAHLTHLKTTSYETHIALNDFYEGILGHIDDIVENWQGANQKLANITIPESKPIEDIITVLKDSAAYCQKVKPEFTGDIQNILDEITGLTHKTIYKLRFLK